jgi:hypothetical protein
MATVELTVDANLQGLRQQLESIPGLTAEQARLMTAELNKSIKASERAAKAAADASKRAMQQATAGAKEASAAVADTGDAFGKLGSNSAKLAGALSMVSPAFGDAARNVADFADVGEVASGVLGKMGPIGAGVAVGLGVLAVAIPLVSEALADQSVESAELMRQYALLEIATQNAAEAQRAYDGALSKVRVETDLVLGLKSKELAATEASIDAFRQQTQAQIDAQQAAIVQAALAKDRIKDDIAAGATVSDRIELEKRLGARLVELDEIQRRARAEQAKSKAELERYVEVKQGELAVTEQAAQRVAAKAKVDAQAAQATKAKKSAEEKDAAAIKAITDEIDAYLKIDADWQRSLEQGRVAAEAQAQAITDKTVKAIETYSSKLSSLVPSQPLSDVEQLQLLIADLDLAMQRAPTEELGMRFKAMSDEAVLALEALQTKTEEAFTIDKAAAFFTGIESYASNLFGNLQTLSDFYAEQTETELHNAVAARKSLGKDATDDEKKQAKERVEDARDASRKQFELTKALQIAQITINTAGAVAQALASSPPPFNAIAAIAAGAAGAVQLATVQATTPKFHKGGLIGQPDESMAVVRAGEAVLNPIGRSMLGDNVIREANAGISQGHGGAVQIVYKHKSFDYFVRDHLRTNATLPRALNAGRRLGQRG